MNALHLSKSHPIDALIFDLDGTLVDSVGDIANAINHALQQLGLPTVSQERVRTWIGAGLPVLCQRAAAFSGIADRWTDIERFARPYYQKHCNDLTKVFDGVVDLLDYGRQHDLPMSVLSNKPHDMVVAVLQALQLESYFVSARGYLDEATKKPNAGPALELCRAMNTPPQRVALVGDSVIDIETARNAGMISIAVTWGFENVESLNAHGPDLTVDSCAALKAQLTASRSV